MAERLLDSDIDFINLDYINTSKEPNWRICVKKPFLNCNKIYPMQQPKVLEILEDVKKDNNVLKVIIFGSSVTYNCHSESDVDIYLELKENSSVDLQYHDFLFDLWNNFTVDTRLKSEIMKKGVTVYDRNIIDKSGS